MIQCFSIATSSISRKSHIPYGVAWGNFQSPCGLESPR